MKMAGEQDAGPELRRRGWRQGSVLVVEPASELAARLEVQAAFAVVVSQDCDVVASEAVEPKVELIPAARSEERDPALLHGRNPRRLMLPLARGVGYLELDIRQRSAVHKHLLCEYAPDREYTVAPQDVSQLARWAAERYKRAAFPDQFNERLKKRGSQLDRLTKRAGKQVVAIFIAIEPNDELPQGADYHLMLWFACRPAVLANSTQRRAADGFARDFVGELTRCEGIVVDEWDCRGLDDITLDDLERMKRFNYDFRSYGTQPGGEPPPDAI